MSGIERVIALADECGWHLSPAGTDRLTVFYKWGPHESHLTRRELHVVTDATGRIAAASLWRNERQDIRHQPGVRAYAERILRGEP